MNFWYNIMFYFKFCNVSLLLINCIESLILHGHLVECRTYETNAFSFAKIWIQPSCWLERSDLFTLNHMNPSGPILGRTFSKLSLPIKNKMKNILRDERSKWIKRGVFIVIKYVIPWMSCLRLFSLFIYVFHTQTVTLGERRWIQALSLIHFLIFSQQFEQKWENKMPATTSPHPFMQ